MIKQRATRSELDRLKSEFLQVLENCSTTKKGGDGPGYAAGSIRHLLRIRGWGHVIKTNEDIEELANLCGFKTDVYPTGGRSGRGTLIVVRDPKNQGSREKTSAHVSSLEQKAQELFGFSVGTKKNAAAAMYLSPKGATTDEITQKVGGPHLNLLKDIKKLGYSISEMSGISASGRTVKRYKIVI